MFLLVIVQSVSSGRNFVAQIALEVCNDVVRLDVPRDVVPPRVGVGAEDAGGVAVPDLYTGAHEPIQLVDPRHKH